MKKATENWLKISRYDLRCAENDFKAELYLKAVQNCHAALEKLLKGIITENGKEPAKIHNLLKLTSEALIENLQEDIAGLFLELNNMFISTRYPDEFENLEQELTKEKVSQVLKDSKRIFSWLEKKIK